jgi:hypothetical protein
MIFAITMIAAFVVGVACVLALLGIALVRAGRDCWQQRVDDEDPEHPNGRTP